MKAKMWWRRLFYNFTFKLIGLDVGPIMFQFRGDYFYIDPYQSMWKIRPTMDPDMPVTIELFMKR